MNWLLLRSSEVREVHSLMQSGRVVKAFPERSSETRLDDRRVNIISGTLVSLLDDKSRANSSLPESVSTCEPNAIQII